MKKFILVVCAAFTLAGCASQMTTIETTYDKAGKPLKTTEMRSDYAAYAAAQEPPKERPKLVDIECPPTGCNFVKFAVYDPGSGGSRPSIAAPPESLAATITHELFSTVRGAIPYAAGAAVLVKAFDKANSSVTTTTTTNTDNSNRSTTNTSTSTSTTTTNDTTTTTTTDNSNNRTATGGGTTTGSGGSGSTGP